MEKLFASALELKQRTQVTSLFAMNGFKIIDTDFDQVIFERLGTKIQVHFDRSANARALAVLDS
ncbi:hypothetical protein H4F05_00630 [Vibrio cholerae]